MDRPGFVETPGGRRATRNSSVFESSENEASVSPSPSLQRPKSTSRRRASAKIKIEEDDTPVKVTSNGKTTDTKPASRVVDGWEEGLDPKVDYSGHFEFGGSLGVLSMMIGFPMLMYYMWIGATYYNGKFLAPRRTRVMANFSRTWSIWSTPVLSHR